MFPVRILDGSPSRDNKLWQIVIVNLFSGFDLKFWELRNLDHIQWPTGREMLPWLVSFMSGFVIAAIVGVIAAWLLMPKLNATHSSISGASTILVFGGDRLVGSDFKTILKRNLFDSEGAEQDTKSIKAGTECTPVKSELPLKFTGVIFGGTSDTSLVVLESTANRLVDSFLLGDLVPGNAHIARIEKDKVYLQIEQKGNCPEYLNLVVPELPKRRVAGVKRKLSKSGLGTKETVFKEDGFEREGSQTKTTKQFLDKALTVDFAKTLQDAKASPNIVGGEVRGFILTRIRPDSVYEKMGFTDGDIIRSINGVELNDAARAIQTLQSLRKEPNIEMDVERGGTAQKFTLQVK